MLLVYGTQFNAVKLDVLTAMKIKTSYLQFDTAQQMGMSIAGEAVGLSDNIGIYLLNYTTSHLRRT
jgi:hypothetical protein